MASITITGTILQPNGTALANAPIIAELLDLFIVTGIGTYPPRSVSTTTNSSGAFSLTLTTPASGAVRYQWTLPTNQRIVTSVSGSTTTTLEALIAATAAQPSATALALHAATEATDGMIAHVPAMTTRAVPSGGAELYVIPGVWQASTSTTLGMAADRIYYSPFIVDRSIRVTAMRGEVTVAVASSLIRFGIVRMDNTGQPTERILDAGTIDGGSATVQTITGLSTILTPGHYASVIMTSAAVTMRAVTTVAPHLIAAWGGSLLPSTYQAVAAFGALPATPPLWTTNAGSSSGTRHMIGYLIEFVE